MITQCKQLWLMHGETSANFSTFVANLIVGHAHVTSGTSRNAMGRQTTDAQTPATCTMFTSSANAENCMFAKTRPENHTLIGLRWMTGGLKEPRLIVHSATNLCRPLSIMDIRTSQTQEMTLAINFMLTRNGQSCFTKYAGTGYGTILPTPKKRLRYSNRVCKRIKKAVPTRGHADMNHPLHRRHLPNQTMQVMQAQVPVAQVMTCQPAPRLR
jgi:hypothetical protein